MDIQLEPIKLRILDVYRQSSWYSDINNSSRLEAYCIYKHNLVFETYLDSITEKRYRTALARFRSSSHNLFIETGRYENTPREERICKSCNMKKVESEYHFLLVCTHYRDLRLKYLGQYYCRWPSIQKFENLLSNLSKKTVNKLAKYIYFAMKKRTVT